MHIIGWWELLKGTPGYQAQLDTEKQAEFVRIASLVVSDDGRKVNEWFAAPLINYYGPVASSLGTRVITTKFIFNIVTWHIY